MELEYKIEYDVWVLERDLPKISKVNKDRIRSAIENKLVLRPEIFARPLRASMRGFCLLRVGEYRVIFQIVEKTVFVLIIQHRSTVYDEALKRLVKTFP